MAVPMKLGYADLLIGTAAEYLVCADLMLMGYPAFRSDQGCPYDIAVDVGHRLIRLQVKSTRSARTFPQQKQRHITGYSWGSRQGKGARRACNPAHFDIIAFVALDTRQVAYVPSAKVKQTFQIPITGHTRSTRSFVDYQFLPCLETLK